MTRKAKVLLVDDEPLVLESLHETIEQEGKYEISLAERGSKALDMVMEEEFAVIITDLMLEDVNGIDLLKSVKARLPETQVIMVSGRGTIDYAVEAMKMGAFDFVSKPISPSHLVQILDRAKAYYDSLVENKQLKGEIRRLKKNYEIIGAHPSMQRIKDIIRNVAPSDSTVLIQGKSGTGKELVARAIHDLSSRAEGPFQAVNCGVFTETLIENELFGHEKGAYTGAVQRAIGRIEASSGGTLFLDEIDTMPLNSQVKLLRVLEDRTFYRVGGTKPIYADFRLIAATNVNLQEAVARKSFREDLYYRLHVISITMPELRERASDVPLLVSFFMDRNYQQNKARSISPEAIELLMGYPWPGNVRELANAVEYAMVLAQGTQITETDLPETIQSASNGFLRPAAQDVREVLSLRDTERELIVRTLKECGGNKHRAAKALRIPRSTLYSKLQKHGIVVDEGSGEIRLRPPDATPSQQDAFPGQP